MQTRLDLAAIGALRCIDSHTIANAVETFRLRPRVAGYVGYDIRCTFPELPPSVEYAVSRRVDSTTEGREGMGFQRLFELLRDAPRPGLVVMQDAGPDRPHSCHAEEIMATTMKRLGAVGILADGGLRDMHQIRALQGFQLFCPGLVVSHGNLMCVSVGDAVTISGLEIRTGDLLHGDANAVVRIPEQCAPNVPVAAQRVLAEEARALSRIKGPEFFKRSAGELEH